MIAFHLSYSKDQGHLKVKFKVTEYHGQTEKIQSSAYFKCFRDLCVMRMVRLPLRAILACIAIYLLTQTYYLKHAIRPSTMSML